MKMMKMMIAVPTMKTVDVEFFSSFMGMAMVGETTLAIESNSLVYQARNKLVMKALDKGADYILWLDSDMVFDSEILPDLLKDVVDEHEFVSGIFFKRSYPTCPTILKELHWSQDDLKGVDHGCEFYEDYPKNQLFEIAGSGLACTLVRTKLITDVIDEYKMSPFTPMAGLGEDYSFCWRVAQMGRKMWCDSRVKIGHVGKVVFDEKLYLSQGKK